MKKTIILKTTLIGDDDFASAMKSKTWPLTRFILSGIRLNIVLSDHAKHINSGFIPDKRIQKIPNAVELPEIVNFREKEATTFCSVGVICERKQTLEIIKYFYFNYSNLKDSCLYIIGPNDKKDGVREFDQDYYDRCLKFINENDLNHKIVFTGKLPKEKIRTYYRRSKGFLFFSLREGLPNVLLEAMSYNCVPIVSVMDNVAYEIIDHGQNGFIMKEEEFHKIPIEEINKISGLLLPYHKIKATFSFPLILTRYKNLYKEIGCSCGKFNEDSYKITKIS